MSPGMLENMEPFSSLVADTERFATQWIVKHVAETRLFHNLAHTRSVVTNCMRLAKLESCPREKLEELVVAAWFHDTGYLAGSRGHEQESVRIATSFLKTHSVSDAFVQRIGDLILATRMPTAPKGLLQEILCDADLSHLGSADYQQSEMLLKRELEVCEGVAMSEQDWLIKNIDFFEHHSYYTRHARLLWNEQKNLNLRNMVSRAGLL